MIIITRSLSGSYLAWLFYFMDIIFATDWQIMPVTNRFCLRHIFLLVITRFPVMWLQTFPPRGRGAVPVSPLDCQKKQWPAYNLASIRICSRRKWLALKSVWSWPLLARVPVVCTLHRVSHHNQTFPQQPKSWLQLHLSYKSLPDLMWPNQLGVFQVVTVGSITRKTNFFFLTLHNMWAQLWLSDGRA